MALQMSWQHSLYRRKLKPPLGLKNLGNSCYLNSVLQCLTYTPPLANFCLKNEHTNVCQSSRFNDGKRDCPFCILERQIVRSLCFEGSLDVPAKIQNSLRVFAAHFRHGVQEDAHEFLRYVIDACHDTCLKLINGGMKNRQPPPSAEQLSSGTILKQIFGGALQSQVTCLSCGTDSIKTDEIMDLCLDVHHSSSLKDAMTSFFQPEVLDGTNKYSCDKCKKLSAARKCLSVLRAPNVLVIQLKRFEGLQGRKIDRAIAFDEVLMLSNYMAEESQDKQPEYNLFGSIVHSGFSAESGHYYAYIKDAHGRWYCCNDSHVTLSMLEEVLSEKAYILFFSRSNHISKPVPNKLSSGLRCDDAKSSGYNDNCKTLMQNGDTLSESIRRISDSHFLQHRVFSNTCSGRIYSDENLPSDNLRRDSSSKSTVTHGNAWGNSSLFVASRTDDTKHLIFSDGPKMISLSKSLEQSVLMEQEITIFKAADSYTGHACSLSANLEAAENLKTTQTYLSPKILVVTSAKDNNVIYPDSSGCTAGYKRKLHSSKVEIPRAKVAPSEMSSRSSDSALQVCKFEEELMKEAKLKLLSCGWVDRLYIFMRERKRLHSLTVDNHVQLRQSLIADARHAFRSRIPELLKAALIERARLFSRGRPTVDENIRI